MIQSVKCNEKKVCKQGKELQVVEGFVRFCFFEIKFRIFVWFKWTASQMTQNINISLLSDFNVIFVWLKFNDAQKRIIITKY